MADEPLASRAVVVDTSRSPHARLRPVPVGAVRLADAFWAPRLSMNRTVTIPAQHRQCEETGRIDNFRRASGRKKIDFQGIFFNDSDVYKWMEAAAFALASESDPALEAMLDSVIDEVAAAQTPSGYLNTYFMFDREQERYTNLRDLHELYCGGHMIQAAVAHVRATGKRTLLEVAIRYADHLCDTFGPDRRAGTDGHEEIELALVELYRVTQDSRYLRLAGFFIDQRGQKPPVIGGSSYFQDHTPYRELSETVGHAVRMIYLNCGAADLVAETGEDGLRAALDRIWESFDRRRRYITGGAGARWEGEAFGDDYELPNDRAYAETCAAIAAVMWSWRMLLLYDDARYADVMETALYNGVLSGLSLDGEKYFYQNPLANRGGHRRQPWFGCACCPPNIARLLASLPGYFYTVSDREIGVHLYARGTAHLALASGESVSLDVDTRYPWDGAVTLAVESSGAHPIALRFRIPNWADGATMAVNDEAPRPVEPGRYAVVERVWTSGDRVRLSLPMPVRLVASHPSVRGNHGQAAIVRGPIVYCAEGTDHPGVDVWDLSLSPAADWNVEARPDLLGGLTVLKASGWRSAPVSDALYQDLSTLKGRREPASITAIPYYAWANREPGPMQVWFPVDDRRD